MNNCKTLNGSCIENILCVQKDRLSLNNLFTQKNIFNFQVKNWDFRIILPTLKDSDGATVEFVKYKEQ
jgi:hypothetical protein